jgi:hypothetical protein
MVLGVELSWSCPLRDIVLAVAVDGERARQASFFYCSCLFIADRGSCRASTATNDERDEFVILFGNSHSCMICVRTSCYYSNIFNYTDDGQMVLLLEIVPRMNECMKIGG